MSLKKKQIYIKKLNNKKLHYLIALEKINLSILIFFNQPNTPIKE